MGVLGELVVIFLHKYRRCGLGSFAAARLFGLFPGSWQIMYHPKNAVSAVFWNKIAETHSVGGLQGEPAASQ